MDALFVLQIVGYGLYKRWKGHYSNMCRTKSGSSKNYTRVFRFCDSGREG